MSLGTVMLRRQLASERASLERAKAQMRRFELQASQSEQEDERREALRRS